MEIKPIKTKDYGSGFSLVDTDLLNQLQADYKEAIEALEELVIESMNNYDNNYSDNIFRQTSKQIHSEEISIIEKAYKYAWEDIRREKWRN